MDEHHDRLSFSSREAMRNWLCQNHSTATVLWVVFHNKKSSEKSVTYDEAVKEAICFGWIDGIVKNIDEKTSMRKFTPRRESSKWSNLNKQRAAEMIEKGLMTDAGRAKLPKYLELTEETEKIEFELPKEFIAQIRKNPQAWATFHKLTNSQVKHYSTWVMYAKKSETRKKRLEELILVLQKGTKLPLK